MALSGERCPACGFPLPFEPWRGDVPSDEMCPCCGIQFGLDDWAGGASTERVGAHARWRRAWIAGGMKWHSRGIAPPPGWDPQVQMEEAGLRGG